MTQKKVGRNDPCPCGSGKKYKQCCLKKEEEAKKTYTSTGKRKFKAKVITLSDKSQSVFQKASMPTEAGPAPTMQDLKFKLTGHDFRVKSSEGEKSPFQRTESDIPTPQKPITPTPTGEFQATTEDFQEKKDEEKDA